MSFSNVFRPASVLIAGTTALLATSTASAMPASPSDPPRTNAQTATIELEGGQMVVVVDEEGFPVDRIRRSSSRTVMLDRDGELMRDELGDVPRSRMRPTDRM